jgi:hypothetical protein
VASTAKKRSLTAQERVASIGENRVDSIAENRRVSTAEKMIQHLGRG